LIALFSGGRPEATIFRVPHGIIFNTFEVKIFFTVHNYFLILLIVPIVIAVGEWKEHGFVVQAG
jgi:hypothetical protein